MYKSIVLFIFFAFSFVLAQDQISNSEKIEVPQNIQSLNEAIKTAEDNEDWDSYYQLREQIIQAWQVENPKVASMYKNTNSPQQDAINESAPKVIQNTIGMKNSFWGNDLLVHSGTATDISMVVNRSDSLFIGVLDNSTTHVYIYVSADGGENWSVYTSYTVSSSNKIELLDFDGYEGSTGPSYLLMFTLYDSGTLWCTRISSTGGSVNSQVVSSDCTDFAVDRNYSTTNYRCFVLFDSASTQYFKRSDPASYATIWQDPYQITACQDPDIAYGLNGTLYLTYVGRNSGNLYINKNYNYGDPTDFGHQHTAEFGATDTTFAPAIIASREDTSSQTIVVVYDWFNNGRRDLRQTYKLGGAGWSDPANWSSSSNGDNKNIELFCRKLNGNNIFQAIFTRTGLNNQTPRGIRYRKYSSGSWNSSTEVNTEEPTGLQNASIVEMNTGLAAFSFAGLNSVNTYFNKEDWIVDVGSEISIPENYTLEQNYPNPFNPSTAIKFTLPENSNVKIKIYDVIGNEVASLVNGTVGAGSHEVTFNAKNLSSGIYLYKMTAIPQNGGKAFVQTKKMMLIK